MYSSIKEFYGSAEWKKCRRDYRAKVQGLCERCRAKGLIVPADEIHHKVRLTIANINDPSIALNFDNLEALCEQCHDLEHEGDARNRVKARWMRKKPQRRYAVVGETGQVITRDTPHENEK